ncbi:MAG TPA: two-component regulator propeller domain-containing protein [Gemmatimonadaceae bacterium]|jgi:signal transduction histidine kinase/ligand-binding sensor domain-containing protein
MAEPRRGVVDGPGGRKRPSSWRRILAIVCASVITGTTAPAQHSARNLAELEHTAFTQRNGAPGQVAALAQTVDGYLWLGTSAGLYRFDGVTFELFAGPRDQMVTRSDIATLMALPDGSLWIGGRIGGASVLSNGRLTTYAANEGLPVGTVFAFARDSAGVLWAATNSGAARFDGQRWTRVGAEVGLRGSSARMIFSDHRGDLWIAMDSGVFRRARGERRFTKRDNADLYSVQSIVESPDGSLWGGVNGGTAVQLSGAQGNAPRKPQPVGLGDVGALLVAHDGMLWAALEGGVARVALTVAGAPSSAAPAPQIFSHTLGLSGSQVLTLLEDREHDVWVGTDGGIDRFRVTRLTPVVFHWGWVFPDIIGGEPNAERGLLIAGGRSLLRIRPESVSQVSKISEPLSAGYRAPDGAVWVGARRGLWRVVNDVAQRIEVPRDAVGSSVASIAVSGDETLWLSVVRHGVYLRRRDGVWSRFDTSATPRPAMTIVPDGSHRMWLGYPNSEVTIADGANVREYSRTDGLDVGNVLAIVPHGERVWIGGSAGVMRFANGRFAALVGVDGDRFRGVSGIVERRNGELWLNGADGISRISPDEAQAFVRDSTHHVRYERFDYHDGLQGIAPQLYPVPSLYEDATGELWFATESSLSHLNPARMPRNELAPPVRVRSLRAGDSTYDVSGTIALPPRTTTIEIRYTALSFVVPERVRFRYQLVGSDTGWQDVGSRREAFYTNLRPGSYRFRVIASNDDGVWNERGDEVAFRIRPTFTQTGWFKLLCWILGAGVIYLLYLLRVRMVAAQIRARFEGTLEERSRIARELHDTLLQGFAGITLHLHGILRSVDDPPDRARAVLARVVEHADAALREARLMVWDMNSPELESSTLAEALEEAARRAVAASPISLALAVRGEERRLARTVEVTALRVGTEAVSNAVKHAGAQSIEVMLEYGGQTLTLSVYDDGRGLSETSIQAAARSGHLGIAGMRERALRAGGTIDIRSTTGAGTAIRLALPCAVAWKQVN